MMIRKAKIVATIGPTSEGEENIRELLKAGVDVARLNFSHGNYEEHAKRIFTLRKISAEMGKPLAILQDLQGPKMRVGNLPEKGLQLSPGQTVFLAPEEEISQLSSDDPHKYFIPFDVPNLMENVKVGKKVLLDDGHLEFEIVDIVKNHIEAKVILGGVLKSHKGVNLPGVPLNIPGFTEKDKNDLDFGIQQEVDFVALSFVRTADDILEVKNTIKEKFPQRADTPIIAKLERPEAISNLQSILEVTDGVMVARGDLAVETSSAEVPIIQKEIIKAANQKGKIVITATQMLDSMIQSPRPTRAEASDVANAIFDGTDAVMLSGETASGAYPIEAVTMMRSIILEAEHHALEWGHFNDSPIQDTQDDASSLTRGARELAHDRNVAAIAVYTETGRTAILMSKARPGVPIMAFTPVQKIYRQLSMCWGVTPFLIPYASTVENLICIIEETLISSTDIKSEDQIVIIAGLPLSTRK
ncbi:MAG: pyruvate kinase, partial [Anaerolineae bacterium]|nr:pyruvate kinase [Anaerolineae bacterium]